MDYTPYDYITIEQKWQDKWFTSKLYEAKKHTNKKYFIHFAYPGVSGYLHVGHMRGFTYCDIIARYKRMTGYDVLFPAGFHASGIPSIGFAKKVERNDPQTIKLLKDHGLTTADIKKLTDPQAVVNYFSKVYVDDYWKRFGFLIDYSRLMNTISKGYNQFITWQFHKLHDKQLLIQKPHFAPYCPNCGPVAVDKSETDIQTGGGSEILEFTIIKYRLSDGTILPAATLRPETIFGVTNMWVNPNVTYHKVQIADEQWLCSHECIQKLIHQFDDIHPLDQTITGTELIGKTCTVPLINREVPILSGPFADPKIATGIVMSVPAHAPYDWIALVESKKPIEPITIIDVKDLGKNPAKTICDELHITSQTETEKLDEATEIVYKKEFHTGVLNDNCGSYAGRKIADIKDDVKNELLNINQAQIMQEFSENVICRCGEHVVIKKIPDQWFIKYSDYQLTQTSIEHSQIMNLYPTSYHEDLPKILEWFDDRAAIRRGSWLGTEFPFKKHWIIEPISDSTLYPAYYIISKYINDKKITAKDMTLAFFDYVFLGIGKPKSKIWDTIKQDFDYWYPVDINLGGKEHKTVHFPVFLMNHVAIMPQQYWPCGIFVHWWVTQKGKEKISKSKGGAEPILEAATTYSVDGMRLYYAHVGSPFVDVEWDPEIVTKYKNRVLNIWQLIQQIHTTTKHKTDVKLDNWLKSILNRHIQTIRNAFESYDLRVASNEIFFECQKNLRWYLKRGGSNTKLLTSFIKTWLTLMAPITPHIAEELGATFGFTTFVSTASYPTYNKHDISEQDEVGEYLLAKVTDDITEILKVTNITPKKICIYTAPQWKHDIIKTALQLDANNNLNAGTLIKTILSDPKNKPLAQQISQYAGKLIGEIKKLSDTDKHRYLIDFDAKSYLVNAHGYLTQLFSCSIAIYNADDTPIYDPAQKVKFAIPLRPAIFIE
jgi:leucyl-tRNA synthetase